MTEAPKEKVPPLAVGDVFLERYEVLGTLGEGGFARVYRCRDTTIDRAVAIKLLKPAVPMPRETTKETSTRQEAHEERFRREARCAARINHPNVVTIHDFGMVDRGGESLPYIIMELIEGPDLRQEIIRMGRMSPAMTLDLVVPCLEALGKVHDEGIVHKDLKPENLIFADGILRIVDFGIARIEGEVSLTATGEMAGTLQYLSPEYILKKEATAAMDVYQMGLIICEMLVGRPVVQATTLLDCVKLYNQGDLELPHALKDTPIAPALNKALRHDPKGRHRDGHDFAAALRAINPADVRAALVAKGIISNRTDPFIPDVYSRPIPDEVAQPLPDTEVLERSKDDPEPTPKPPNVVVSEPTEPAPEPSPDPKPQPEPKAPSPTPKAQEEPKPRKLWIWALVALMAISGGVGMAFVFGGFSSMGRAIQEAATFHDSPIIPVGNSPSKGYENSVVVMVVFNDFTSRDGALAVPVVDQIRATYGEDVRLVYKHAHSPKNKVADQAARAAAAAHAQGSFWSYRGSLFQDQKSLGKKALIRHAERLVADVDLFKKQMKSKKIRAVIEADQALAKKLGVKRTPTIFVNGVKMVGAPTVDELKKLVDAELAAFYNGDYLSYEERVAQNQEAR